MLIDFKSIVPNGSRVSSSFNPNRNAPTAGASTNHKGSDIAAPLGSSVVNQSEGKVVFVGDNPAVQSHASALSQVLRDIENDSYFEKTEWIAAKDGAGNAQGLLVLDFDQNGLIETRDILNLGGNMGQDGNPTAQPPACKAANDELFRNVA